MIVRRGASNVMIASIHGTLCFYEIDLQAPHASTLGPWCRHIRFQIACASTHAYDQTASSVCLESHAEIICVCR